MLDMEFSKNFNILYGDNAQGKTNILESIFICASGRSHRTSRDMELIKMGEDSYYIRLDVEKESGKKEIEVSYKQEEKKRVRINGVQEPKIGSLMGNLNTVMFSPEDLMIIKQGPSERRRFIDITISQLRPSYFFDLQQYNKVLVQRNTLLKSMQNNRRLVDTLDVWNRNLAGVGARIVKVRNEFIEKLSEYSEKSHRKLTNGEEKLTIKYSPSIKADSLNDVQNVEESFIKLMEISVKKEMEKCTTLYGPQRDDYDICLDGLSLKMFGSQGQQRTAVLSVKLAEIEIMKEDTGEAPVLLLDDVMSELDQNRQEYLINNLKSVQTFITCTDKDFFSKKSGKELSFYHVVSGCVLKE
jgi:DNA replication and repair protein RecF